MARALYALLVGINDYPSTIGGLSGCLNDVDHVRDYLTSTVDPAGLALEVLKDHDATRANIIKQFRTHLGRATADDAVLFHYCGHGAQWASAPEFAPFFPEGKDEGLVCIDSRSTPDSYDLADKELAILVDEVARSGAHVAVVLDCCHSGSGTRDADSFAQLLPRMTHEVLTARPLDSYLDGYYAQQLRAGQLSIPRGRHVLLAACDRTERAMERKDRSGVFTSVLLDALASTGANVSYADLFVRCRELVRRETLNQNPQFEAYGRFNARHGYLGRPAAAASRRVRVTFEKGDWWIQAGAVNGLADHAAAPVAIYAGTADQPLATATIATVGFERSVLKTELQLDSATQYMGELTGFDPAPLPVLFEGDDAARQAMAAALAARPMGVALTDVREGTRYRMVAAADRWSFERIDPPLAIRSVRTGTESPAAGLLDAMAAVASWERVRTLQNPRTQLDRSKVGVVFTEHRPDGTTRVFSDPREITLDYSGADIHGRITVANQTSQRLNVVLVYFTQKFGMWPYKGEVDPGQTITLWGDDEANEALMITEDDRNEEVDEFSVFVSTEKVDGFALDQPELTLGELDPADVHRGVRQFAPKTTPPIQNDWFSVPMRFRTVRQINRVAQADARIADAIVVKANPAVTAQIGLSAAGEPARGVDDGSDFHRALTQQGLQLVDFGAGTRGGAQQVLELSEIEPVSALQEHPIEIDLHVPLADDEAILPVVFDGQHAMLAGDVHRSDDGTVTRVSIDRLPDTPSTRRSLGGSLKLYFFKTALKQQRVNQLRWIEYGDGDAFTYHESGIGEKVGAAKSVLLLVHGIIGDTEGMVRGVRACGLDRRFDLVLTYDYENLSTPIADTARELKDQLAAAGLREGDDKRLTLLVHSMGGLVSRWFIEREGGNGVVDHLVMCGTPNGGSPFGRVDAARTILNTLTSLAMNYLPVAIPYAGTALLLINRSKQLTPTLEQMNPSSEFIATLNASPDPGVRYTILAGDVHEYREAGDPAFDRLLTKVGQGSLGDLLFASRPHDIAVGVESILGVRAGTPRAPVQRQVACHHLNYFASAAGHSALTAVEW